MSMDIVFPSLEMFSPKMERIMQEILTVTEVSLLAEEIENDPGYSKTKGYRKDKKARTRWLFSDVKSVAKFNMDDDDDDSNDDTDDKYDSEMYKIDDDNSADESKKKDDSLPRKSKKGSLFQRMSKMKGDKSNDIRRDTGESENMEIGKLLGEWKEPDINVENMVSIRLLDYDCFVSSTN